MALHETSHGARVETLGPGRTVDNGDQVSSVVLLGIAVVGGALSVLLNALVV